MDTEQLLKKIKEFTLKQEQAKETYHQCVGAIQILKELVATEQKKADKKDTGK